MYHFKIEKKEQFLEGRKIKYVAEIVGIVREYLTDILNNRRGCSKTTAYCIVKALHEDKEINDYFDVIKK